MIGDTLCDRPGKASRSLYVGQMKMAVLREVITKFTLALEYLTFPHDRYSLVVHSFKSDIFVVLYCSLDLLIVEQWE